MVLGKGSGSSTGEDDGDVCSFNEWLAPYQAIRSWLYECESGASTSPHPPALSPRTLTPRPKMLTVPLDRAVFSGALSHRLGSADLHV